MIDIAQAAIANVATPSRLSHMWVHVLESNLNLGFYEKAFTAMMAISDERILVDSLRQVGECL